MTRPTSGRTGALTRVAGLLLAAGMVLVLGGIGTFVIKYRAYNVLSDSMEPTLRPDDRILSDTAAAGGDEVRRGDIVMLAPDAWPAEPEIAAVVKRVVAIGGDRLSFTPDAGRLEINGTPVTEDYLSAGVLPAYERFAVEVPAGHIFVLGDNRPGSIDSRAHLDEPKSGSVPAGAVLGRAVARAYPFDRARMLPSSGSFGSFGGSSGTDSVVVLAAAALAGGAVLLVVSGGMSLAARLRQN